MKYGTVNIIYKNSEKYTDFLRNIAMYIYNNIVVIIKNNQC